MANGGSGTALLIVEEDFLLTADLNDVEAATVALVDALGHVGCKMSVAAEALL